MRIDLGTTEASTGRMILIDAEDGMFIPADPVDLTDELDGSVTLSYAGAGYHSPDATFDPPTWQATIGTLEPVEDMEVSGTLSSDRTEADVTLTDGVGTYILEDPGAPEGASAALSGLADDIESEDWAGVYGRLDSFIAGGQSEGEFEDAMGEAMSAHGEVVSADLSGEPTVSDNGAGWDVASSGLDIEMLNNGCSNVYSTEVELVWDGSWQVSNLGQLESDDISPSSSVGTLDELYVANTASISVPFSVSEDTTGISRVELWWRSVPYDGGDYSEWQLGPVGTTSPLTFVPEPGPGDYEFYTVAVDNAGNEEAPPEGADAVTSLDAPTLTPDYVQSVLGGEPIAYWRLSELDGATAVDETTDFDGTYHGSVGYEGPALVLDFAGNTAITFDGSSTYVTGSTDAAFALAETGQKSFEFWLMPVDEESREVIFHRGSSTAGYDYSIYWQDGQIGAVIYTAGGTERAAATSGTDTVPADQISHVVVTLDDATDRIEFFVNGVSVASDTDAWTGSSSSQDTDPIVIGRNDETEDHYFSGVLDEVAVYNGVLAPIQVQAHYLAGSWTPPQP